MVVNLSQIIYAFRHTLSFHDTTSTDIPNDSMLCYVNVNVLIIIGVEVVKRCWLVVIGS